MQLAVEPGELGESESPGVVSLTPEEGVLPSLFLSLWRSGSHVLGCRTVPGGTWNGSCCQHEGTGMDLDKQEVHREKHKC